MESTSQMFGYNGKILRVDLTGKKITEEAIDAFKRLLNRNPNFHPAHVYLAVMYIELGWTEEAGAEWTEFVRRSPETSPEAWRQRLPYKDQTVLERLFGALAKVSLI